jgi:threonylcarbamoyladenosine tRNA methylthiotransferase MtaB
LPLGQVIREVETLVAAGYREVVISGINLGRWGRDLAVGSQLSALGKTGQRSTTNGQRPAFEDLVRTILSDTELEKLRISSVEPMDWSDELVRMMAESPRIAKHAHVPLQSGSDAVLRRMHRKYRPWHYREKIEKIRTAMPAAAIGADVMVGFPGETDAEFEATRRMIEELAFTYLHVFTYSPRPGTPAASMPNQVPVHIARDRNRILRELAAEKKLAFMRSFIGKTIDAITLKQYGAGAPARAVSGTATFCNSSPVRDSETEESSFPRTDALTDNYLKMQLHDCLEANRWVRAKVEGVDNGALVGSCVRSS